MDKEKRYCDFIIKIDTDEIICHYDAIQRLISLDRLTILSSLDNLVYDGSKYQVGYVASNKPLPTCNDEDDTMLRTSLFTNVTPTTFKAIAPSKSYRNIDLGGHRARLWEPYNNYEAIRTNITILHFTHPCFNRYVENMHQAVVRHNVLNGTETIEESIIKLKANQCVQAWIGTGGPKCGCASCHKVGGYYRTILNLTEAELNYINDQQALYGMTFKDLSYKLNELNERYSWLDSKN